MQQRSPKNKLNTTEKFASFLYKKYIADVSEEGNLEEMKEGLQDCDIKQLVENFRGSVCVHQF